MLDFGLSRCQASQSKPSSDEEGGLLGEASILPGVKSFLTHRFNNQPRNRTKNLECHVLEHEMSLDPSRDEATQNKYLRTV